MEAGLTGGDAKSLGWGVGGAVVLAAIIGGAYLIYARIHPTAGAPSTTLTEQQKSEALQSLSASTTSASNPRPVSKEEQKALNSLSAPAPKNNIEAGTAGSADASGGMSAEDQRRVLESLQSH